jgi:TM2 domain-containing membrane protein YozV
VFGIHRFYIGRPVIGILMLVTGGAFGVWTLIDLILAIMGTLKDGEGRLVNLN